MELYEYFFESFEDDLHMQDIELDRQYKRAQMNWYFVRIQERLDTWRKSFELLERDLADYDDLLVVLLKIQNHKNSKVIPICVYYVRYDLFYADWSSELCSIAQAHAQIVLEIID